MKDKWTLFEETYLNQSGFNVQAIAKDNDNRMLVCNVYGNSEKESQSNAKLIATSPELLEALKLAVTLLYGSTEFEALERYRKEVDNFEQLIKKATE